MLRGRVELTQVVVQGTQDSDRMYRVADLLSRALLLSDGGSRDERVDASPSSPPDAQNYRTGNVERTDDPA